MRPLQAYDYLFTVTSASENRAVTTDQRIWVWAQPLGRAHTHQLKDTPPSASQRRVGGQNADNLLAYAFRRDQVRTKSMPENAQGERPYCHLRFFFAFVFPFLGCPSSFGATDTKPAALGEVSESTNLNKRSKISPKVKEPNRAAQNSAELSLD